MVLIDNSTQDCSLLNVLTMEKLQFPKLEVPISEIHLCVVSFSKDGWRIIFFDRHRLTAISSRLGDSKFVEHHMTVFDTQYDRVQTAINFEGKLYAFTRFCSLAISNHNLDFTCVISGKSIERLFKVSCARKFYLVESCGELLLVFINYWNYKIVAVKIFKADLNSMEWVKLDTIGDRVIFLDEFYGFSSMASCANCLKRNTIYQVRISSRKLVVYDIEDQSFFTSPLNPKFSARSNLFRMPYLNK